MNSSALQEYHGWRGEPSGRGTWSILLTCFITLTLCVWTAVHLNLQGKQSPGLSGKLESILYKPRWIVVGLFAPEVLVYMAWSQWLSARMLKNEMQKIRRTVRYSCEFSGINLLTPIVGIVKTEFPA
jgi:hypothetical protein